MIVVVAGRWAKGEDVSIKIVVGGTFLAVTLAVMSNANEQLASKFALAILVTVLLTYMVPIAKKAGFSK
jgi:hypothetical protein